ncbi:MAG TPA: peroxiredoxin [Tepidisphaeraceae bacterium]|jgi:peroxiredoxin|nr:peroxiredoxin [Tepidisphaeraceae bacterium]
MGLVSQSDYTQLPPNLPVPTDDGACDHLPGTKLPAITLPSTGGGTVMLAKREGTTIVYCYPMSGVPGVPLPDGWDQIPGARGCTPQSCGFRDRDEQFKGLNVTVYGLSTQTTDYQKEFASRLHLPFELLSDVDLRFTTALRLPTFEVEGKMLIKRLTLVVCDGAIRKVFYPVFPPDGHAAEVLVWLRGNGKG